MIFKAKKYLSMVISGISGKFWIIIFEIFPIILFDFRLSEFSFIDWLFWVWTTFAQLCPESLRLEILMRFETSLIGIFRELEFSTKTYLRFGHFLKIWVQVGKRCFPMTLCKHRTRSNMQNAEKTRGRISSSDPAAISLLSSIIDPDTLLNKISLYKSTLIFEFNHISMEYLFTDWTSMKKAF